MSDKQTQCPKCLTIYKVTVAQLTVAQGMVCCPKCAHSFHALLHLVKIQIKAEVLQTELEQQQTNINNSQSIDQSSNLLAIFTRKVEQSNIDLETYLNNLNYFSTEPIKNMPALNLAEDNAYKSKKKASVAYYMMWCVINLSIISILSFQILMRNQQLLIEHPSIDTAFTTVCHLFHCSSLEQQYALIGINKIKIHEKDKYTSRLTGELINKNERSLQTPLLLVKLSKDGNQIFNQTYSSHEYLISSLKNVERIPQNSPFKFNILLPVPLSSFDDYDLQIIQP